MGSWLCPNRFWMNSSHLTTPNLPCSLPILYMTITTPLGPKRNRPRHWGLTLLKIIVNHRKIILKDYYLFFGLIRDYKGLDLLLEAMSCKKLKDNKAELIVAGEFYSNEEKYRELSHYLALENRIHWFPRFIPDNQVCHFFIVSDLIVQPYKTATQSGITQIAYSFDKPMVVTRVGGLAEIVPDGKCGYVVEPEPHAIADAIDDFYTRRPDFSAGIALQKKEFSWSRMTENLLNLFSLTRPKN